MKEERGLGDGEMDGRLRVNGGREMEGNRHRKGRCSLTPIMLAYNQNISSTTFNDLKE